LPCEVGAVVGATFAVDLLKHETVISKSLGTIRLLRNNSEIFIISSSEISEQLSLYLKSFTGSLTIVVKHEEGNDTLVHGLTKTV
jgi:phosphoribosylformylglycinamidine (FGAM) synthase-like amidotransferase family enzyme